MEFTHPSLTLSRGKTEARRGQTEGPRFPRELVAKQEFALRSPRSGGHDLDLLSGLGLGSICLVWG